MEIIFHRPVLVDAVLQFLPTASDGVYVDGTLGGGGHAEAIVTHLSTKGKLVGFDHDVSALAVAQKRLDHFSNRITYVNDNFANMADALNSRGIRAVDGILLDLGVSSHQIDEAERGFSFQQQSRLDMRMNCAQPLDAWTIVNTYTQDRLTDILWRYGEERHARRISRRILAIREQRPINTTFELVNAVRSSVGGSVRQKSLARVFQAIRIEVNAELDNLVRVLHVSLDLLRRGGRIVVISYHSLEDRIVKEFFREESRVFIPSGSRFLPDKPRHARLRTLTTKPIVASDKEIKVNPRARSAKLRTAERI
jgi:16S rRNA (cytosine1402-N4)-methyltransferase